MRMFHHRPTLHRLALSAAVAAGLSVGAVQADVAESTSGLPSNVTEYNAELNGMQMDIDRQQAELDREQAELDRRRYRFREHLEDTRWRFNQLDADGDLRITEAEAQSRPAVAQMFDSLDSDDNGALRRSEFRELAVRRLRSTGQ